MTKTGTTIVIILITINIKYLFLLLLQPAARRTTVGTHQPQRLQARQKGAATASAP
jgi:hypothetical protein